MSMNYKLVMDWLRETKDYLSRMKSSTHIDVSTGHRLVVEHERLMTILQRQVDMEDEGWLTTNNMPPHLFSELKDSYLLLKKILSSNK